MQYQAQLRGPLGHPNAGQIGDEIAPAARIVAISSHLCAFQWRSYRMCCSMPAKVFCSRAATELSRVWNILYR